METCQVWPDPPPDHFLKVSTSSIATVSKPPSSLAWAVSRLLTAVGFFLFFFFHPCCLWHILLIPAQGFFLCLVLFNDLRFTLAKIWKCLKQPSLGLLPAHPATVSPPTALCPRLESKMALSACPPFPSLLLWTCPVPSFAISSSCQSLFNPRGPTEMHFSERTRLTPCTSQFKSDST